MAKETENLVLEHLRSIRTDVSKLSQRMDNLTAELRGVKGRLAAVDSHVTVLVENDLRRDDRFSAIELRLDRIENRLDLVD